MTLDIAENRFVPDCSGVVTARAFVAVNLLVERLEMSVYYYLLLLLIIILFTACVNLMYVGRPAVMVSAILAAGIGLLYWLLHHYLYCLFFLCTINFFFFFFFFYYYYY